MPATTANLGPGFDCLGAALGLYLELVFEAAPSSETVAADPAFVAGPVGEDLTHRAFVGAWAAVGEQAPPVKVTVARAYPAGRGLGASASAIVGGLVGARALGGLALSDDELAGLAVRIEGHADNVLPALFGGLVLAGSGVGWQRFTPSPAVCPIVLVAREAFATKAARQVLPDAVPRADALANMAACAALVAILAGLQSPTGLLRATEDRLHEPYRLPLMTETRALHAGLRAAGVPAALSGAGPSVLILVDDVAAGEAREVARDLLPDGWGIADAGWDLTGARAH
ncbi:MAG TPA: homoserine kinase [Actinomycetota bacterium]|nr:homoserine kinase [Actinomycetota bacterium]